MCIHSLCDSVLGCGKTQACLRDLRDTTNKQYDNLKMSANFIRDINFPGGGGIVFNPHLCMDNFQGEGWNFCVVLNPHLCMDKL